MTDVFISYARASESLAARAADALRALGHEVWRDDQIPAHRSYTDVIEERLRAARAVIVLWSADAVQSQWVRAEANVAREAGRLVQARLDRTPLPLPYNDIQCADCTGWDGDPDHPGWRKVVASLASLLPAKPVAPVAPATPAAVAALVDSVRLLAVLPFDNLSGDADTGYFSDGVSEEILHTVSRCRGLRVLGKASTFSFRGADKSVPRIRSELKAAFVLDGSVRRSGERIRVTAQLVDAGTQETLWSERYDRALTDIFALQDDIAAAIADAVDAHFVVAKPAAAVDPVAYDLYLQARAAYAQDATDADRARCVALLEQAVARAPDFAVAWGQLAMFRGMALPRDSERGGAMARPTITSEAERARALDPDCGPAHTALALTIPAFTGYAERIRLAQRAYELAPSDSSVGHLHAGCLLAVGRARDACAVFDDVVAREPGSPYSQGVRAFFHFAAGSPDRALDLARRAVEDFPGAVYPRYMLEQIERGTAALRVARDPKRGAASLEKVEREAASAHPVHHIVHAARAARLGATDRAFDWLFGAIDAGHPLSLDLAPDGRGFSRTLASVGLFSPIASALRADPRFAELCVRLGLHDYWTETGTWPDCAAELPYDLRAAAAAAHARGVPRYREAA